MDDGRTITLELPYGEAVSAVKETFQEHGFGTLTEIDVRATDDGTLVEALDPHVMVSVQGQDDLQPIADEAAEKINAALDQLEH